MVGRLALNQVVAGSSPAFSANFITIFIMDIIYKADYLGSGQLPMYVCGGLDDIIYTINEDGCSVNKIFTKNKKTFIVPTFKIEQSLSFNPYLKIAYETDVLRNNIYNEINTKAKFLQKYSGTNNKPLAVFKTDHCVMSDDDTIIVTSEVGLAICVRYDIWGVIK